LTLRTGATKVLEVSSNDKVTRARDQRERERERKRERERERTL
jgi:hypothetical protein